MKVLVLIVSFVSFLLCAEMLNAANPKVTMKTSLGDIEIELYPNKAPVSVENFLSYVDADAYDNVIFHRVIPGFMVQTGGYYEDLSEAEDGEAIKNEADNGLKNLRGTLSMARMNEIDSATRQFFINVIDNAYLDHTDQSCSRADEKSAADAQAKGLFKPMSCKTFGYAVFGKVTSGMDVVEAIELVDTQPRQGHRNVPIVPVTILSIERGGIERVGLERGE